VSVDVTFKFSCHKKIHYLFLCFPKVACKIQVKQEVQNNLSFLSLYICRLVGKVAADNSHKWVYNESHNNECEASYIATWNTSVEPVREVIVIDRYKCNV